MVDTDVKNPKLSISNIKSPLSGDGIKLGKVGQGGVSKIGTLAKIVRKNRISINSLVKSEEVQDEKITKIKNIIKTKQQNIGKKLPRSGDNIAQKLLIETNKILVEIQQQIAIAFGMRNAEEKEKNENLKEERSRRRLRLREGALESVKKIGGAIKKTAKFVASPFKSFFDKILEFISLLGLGIGANAVFGWFEKEENREKLKKVFKIIISNWKLIRNILGVIGGLIIGGKIIALGTSIAALAGPLAVLAAAVGTVLLASAVADSISGGGQFAAFDEEARKKLLRSNKVSQGGVVLNEKGDAVKFKDSFGNKTLSGSVMTEIMAKEAGLDPDEYAKSVGMALPSQVRAYLGKEKYNEAIAGVQAYRKAMQNKDKIKNEYFKELDKIAPKAWWDPTGKFRMVNADEYKKDRVGALDEKYGVKLAPLFEKLAGERALGGPVMSGNAYLVGEKGPELFAPNIDGSIINNMRTEKIYEMISSKNAGKINFVSMELPPKFMNSEKNASTEEQQEIPIPTISAVNGSNPYMSITPNVYGIYV